MGGSEHINDSVFTEEKQRSTNKVTTNAVCYINMLPNEILAVIIDLSRKDVSRFLECGVLLQERGIRAPAPVSLSVMSVSRKWHDTVSQTRSLHSTITVVLKGEKIANWMAVEGQLNLCGLEQPISLVLDTHRTDMPSFFPWCGVQGPTVDWLWRRIRGSLNSLTFSTNCGIVDVVRTDPHDLQDLHEVVALTPKRVSFAMPSLADAKIWSAPTIRSLRYVGFGWREEGGLHANAPIRWEALRSVEYDDPSPTHVCSAEAARDILYRGRALTKFQGAVTEAWPHDVQVRAKPIHHGLLHTFTLHYNPLPDDFIPSGSHTFFEDLSFPNLQSCTITLPPWCDASQPLVLFLQSLSRLTSLSLPADRFDHSVLVGILAELPLLTCLALEPPSNCAERRPERRSFEPQHECDRRHLCDNLLEAMTGSAWGSMRQRVVRKEGSREAGFVTYLGGLCGIDRPTSDAELDLCVGEEAAAICKGLNSLSLHHAEVSSIGLKAFVRSRARCPTILGSISLPLWMCGNPHQLHRLQQELWDDYGVGLNGTCAVRAEARDPPSWSVRTRDRFLVALESSLVQQRRALCDGWGLSRQTRRCGQEGEGWGKSFGEENWGNECDVALVGMPSDGWGLPTESNRWHEGRNTKVSLTFAQVSRNAALFSGALFAVVVVIMSLL